MSEGGRGGGGNDGRVEARADNVGSNVRKNITRERRGMLLSGYLTVRGWISVVHLATSVCTRSSCMRL
jgi:hypothetical protein